MSRAGAAFTFPPPLVPGAVVRVVAPAGPFEVPLLWRGLGFLRERYRVRFDRGIFSRQGFLAGSDERRLAELSAALAEPEVGAVLCARGGYGLSRIAHLVAWASLARAPRWLVGFSDATVLHVEAAAVGVASLHGINVSGLGRGDAVARASLVDALEAPARARRFSGLATVVAGQGEGVLFGGNLTLLHACATAGRLRAPERCVLFLEDVGERAYRIDRMLTTLLVGGHLANVAAIVLGDFTDCDGGDAVLVERLSTLGVPIASGLPCGHGRSNEPLVVGAPAVLDASRGVLSVFGG
jgi:muramoyltetrapeptide carboxypeptidase